MRDRKTSVIERIYRVLTGRPPAETEATEQRLQAAQDELRKDINTARQTVRDAKRSRRLGHA